MQQQMDMTPDMAAALVRLRAACARPLDADERGNRARYASLSHIIETLSPILAEHGFAVLHSQASAGIVGERVETKSGRNGQSYEQQITLLDVTAVCRLVHESGGYVDSSYSTIVEAGRGINERDAIAGGYTNARRYSLLAACGVAVTQDDSAETLGTSAPVQAARPPAPEATAPRQAAPPPAPVAAAPRQAAPPLAEATQTAPAREPAPEPAPESQSDPLAEFLDEVVGAFALLYPDDDYGGASPQSSPAFMRRWSASRKAALGERQSPNPAQWSADDRARLIAWLHEQVAQSPVRESDFA